MPTTSRIALCFAALAVALVTLLSGCVAKGKYLTALERAERAQSSTAVAKTDVAEVLAERDRLRRKLEAQRLIIEQLNRDKQAVQSRQRSSTQDYTNRLRLGEERSRGLAAQRDSLQRLLAAERAPVQQRTERLRRLSDRLSAAVAEAPPGQHAIRRTPEYVILTLDDNLLFANGKAKISGYGDALLSRIARALGGQPTLRASVLALPVKNSAGTKAAWEEASRRAVALAHALVEGKGLLPQVVTAAAQEGALAALPGVPAEARASSPIVITVRIAE